HSARSGGARIKLVALLAAAGLLGTVFLVIKGYEYYLHYLRGEVPVLNWTVSGVGANHVQLFFWLYFAMTGVHAIHLIIGIGLVGVMILRAFLGHLTPDNY